MEVLVLNEEFESIYLIDSFESLIWTDRYSAYGDFELYLPMKDELLDFIKVNYYLWQKESEHTMIIEKIEIDSDVEQGNHMIVTGRSLESILTRRIVWGQYNYSGTVDEVVQMLLEDTFISPANEARKVDNFVYVNTNDDDILATNISIQFTGTEVYDAMIKICERTNIGFKMVLTDDNKFIFSIYKGIDHSYQQDLNPYVIFSPTYDNLINSSYFESNENYKTVTLVAGEGEGARRKTTTIDSGITGLRRRELYTDARDISSMREDGSTIPDSEYYSKLTTRGINKLLEADVQIGFEGAADTMGMFKYGKDFSLGDVVQVGNEYGNEETVYVSELVFSQSKEGYTVCPTFKVVTEYEEEEEL